MLQKNVMNKIAVIVPIYNMSSYMDKCIHSVIMQTYSNFKLILIDDGSTDDSLEKTIQWKKRDERIVVVSQTNAGLGVARNVGVHIADSEYVTFLDSDDWWHPDYLKQMMEGTEHGKNDIVLCDINFVYLLQNNAYDCYTSRLRFPEGALNVNREWNLLNKARTFMWGKVYRRKLFLDYGIEQPSHAYEDVATTPYILAKAKTFYHVPKGLYYYLRNREGSIVNRFSSLRDLLKSLDELMHRFQTDCLLEENRNTLRQLIWGQLSFIHHSLKKRFPLEEQGKKETLKKEAIDLACKWFPELNDMPKCSFFVPSQDKRIVEAIKHLVLEEKSIFNDRNTTSADFYVDFQFDNESKNNAKRILLEKPTNSAVDDMERISWDLADEIFKRIWGGMK